MYDAATDGYKLAIKEKRSHDAKVWKERMAWLDVMLKEQGEA